MRIIPELCAILSVASAIDLVADQDTDTTDFTSVDFTCNHLSDFIFSYYDSNGDNVLGGQELKLMEMVAELQLNKLTTEQNAVVINIDSGLPSTDETWTGVLTKQEWDTYIEPLYHTVGQPRSDLVYDGTNPLVRQAYYNVVLFTYAYPTTICD